MTSTIPRILRPALVFVLCALSIPALAQQDRALERARTEIGELRYEDALTTLNKLLKSGDNGPAATAEIYLLLGEVRASLGQKPQAIDAFELALAIDPALDLRKGLSPKIREPFASARRVMRDKKALSVVHRILTSDPPAIAVVTQSDPLRMLVGARVVYWTGEDKERTISMPGKDRIDVKLLPGVTGFVISGLDSYGNRIVEIGTREEPLTLEVDDGRADPTPTEEPVATPEAETAPAAADVTVEAASDGTPFLAHWLLWGGVAVGLGAAGTWAGLSARSAISDLEDSQATEFTVDYTEARQIADRAENRALIANVSFGVAGACAIVSGYLFWRQRKSSSGGERAVVAPILGRDQAGITAAVRF